MKPVYAHVDRAACIACGLCQMLAPKLFDYDSEGIASYHPDGNTGTKPVDPADLIDLKIAFRRCPTGAIQHSEQPFNDNQK
ncbi:ferredoxin [Lacticaseibacillus hegangensis]|uniref:Ferredoxin n=1 Tax=Lacticaseibacillus hegangensis TaxID=2486010 RepID=A0ABW4CZN9_9LACO|nr:ferredoxin [Lacticaseibacillus hegangensis]